MTTNELNIEMNGRERGFGVIASMIGRKSPFFGASRQIYTENFGPGLLSGRRREVPGARHPRTLVGPLQKL